MNKPIGMGQPLSLLTAALTAMAVCWVAGCAKKSGQEAVPETRDTLTVMPDTLSKISGTLTDKRDGKTYKTVKIGKQTWMAENLNYKPESGNSWCYEDSCAKYADSAKYGRLYDWTTAMGGAPSSSISVQGVCPTEWHLPSNQDWQTLVDFIGGREVAGKKLKSTSGWHDWDGNNSGNGTDEYGFSALPGGYRSNSDGSFGLAGNDGDWWTATQGSSGYAYYRGMDDNNDYVGENYDYKDLGFSVRCVRDGSATGASSQKSVGDDRVKIEMVFVKGGIFRMGCTSEQGNDCFDWEKPAHSVTVSDFYIGKYEVTQNQWVQVMGGDNNQSYFKGDNLPVENVSWNDAQKFILRLNTETGKKYRLPTEAEWEYAARGGASSKGYKYSGSNRANDVAWYYVNSGDTVLRDGLFEEYDEKDDFDGYHEVLSSNKNRMRAVGTKAPNELGIYDMSGNVWEWVNDYWHEKYSSAAQTNPSGPTSGSGRVLRSGSWDSGTRSCRVSERRNTAPDDRGDSMGFRLALSP